MRIKAIIYFIIIICIVLLVRVYDLSIKSNTYYEELSKQNYIKNEHHISSRGQILDRNGVPLAINKVGFSITIKPHLRKSSNRDKLESVLKLIEKHLPDEKYVKLYKKYKKADSAYRHDYISVVDYVAYDDFFKHYTLFNSNENINIVSTTKRFYPYKDIGAHIIGYTGKVSKKDIKKDKNNKYFNTTGRSGLERYYDKKLNGTVGTKKVKVNAIYEVVEVLEETPSKSENIQISLDIRMQEYIHKLFGDSSGAVVVMDVENGELIAAGSFPEFDNNLFVNGISHKDWNNILYDFNHPFTNKLVNGVYPPGSVIKMAVADSFLENGIKENFSVYCNGVLPLGKRKFRCWKTHGHGKTGFTKALRESCDDFFYKASLEIGINKIHKTLDKFGMGRKTGIDQPNESKGINPNKQWKKSKYNQPWYIGETVISSIGQGFLNVTPIQIARYTAGLATNKLPRPHFLLDDSMIEHEDLNISKKHIKILQNGMYEVANKKHGTAVNYIKSKIIIAAKTGTAQVVGIPQDEKVRMKEEELKYFNRSHAWLTSYAPYKNPKYAVTVIVEHGGHGGSTAGGIVGKIFDKLNELGYIPDIDIKK